MVYFIEQHGLLRRDTLPGPKLPDRIARLNDLASNLWWSWHDEARAVFRALDYPLWRSSGHNPVRQLHEISSAKLEAAANDPAFLLLYDRTIAAFDASLPATKTWFADTYPGRLNGPVAFFSAEFAIHSSLPIYAGGLGILAGDICKEANDLGLPFVGVGFMYPQGYFEQRISPDGWQEETYRVLDFEAAPINPCAWPEQCGPLIPVPMGERTVYVQTWQVWLGRVRLYLLDTNVAQNSPGDRQLSARLYTADREQRLQQEIVLGMGGVRVLRGLGIEPSVWHANEGHTSFMMLERVRELVASGVRFDDAAAAVRAHSVFTTHTPVPAGHDIFPAELIDRYLGGYWNGLGVDRQAFFSLGQAGPGDQGFNMTVLALRLAEQRTAVSKVHGAVTRAMWHSFWPAVKEEDVPIGHITNGIHIQTWAAPELDALFSRLVGKDFLAGCDGAQYKDRVLDIPDEELWAAHVDLKRKLVHMVLERAQQRWASGNATAEQTLAMGALLDSDSLTIGFARRFTEYKRPALIFRDIERLIRIISNPWRPVQIIFAGKSHPADFPSKYLIHQVYNLAKDRRFQGRIAFLEDYDMHLAHYLVQGVDVWLNNPRRRQEASGTSGMKAAINGIPHLSVRDGWWEEGYNGRNGWVIGEGVNTTDPDEEDRLDSLSLYDLLEKEVVPLYYDRDRHNVPHGWMKVFKETVGSIMPFFCTARMMKEYIDRMYLPAARPLEKQV